MRSPRTKMRCLFSLFKVDRVYPLVLGSNIGTTATALIAGLAAGNRNSLQVIYVTEKFYTNIHDIFGLHCRVINLYLYITF